MNTVSLNKAILALIKIKSKLVTMGYDHPDYDDVEENLHDKEDEFLDIYGDFLENILQDVHKKHCPDNDVLLSTAYLPNSYKENINTQSGESTVAIEDNDGILVDLAKYPNVEARMLLLPNPTRILIISAKTEILAWTS